jgi:hypothetical protein
VLSELAARNRGPRALTMLAVILVVAGGLRVGFAADSTDFQPPDSRAYARLAENLYESGSFDASREGERPAQPSSTYAPGLPLLVAGIYTVTGGEDRNLARIVLALFGTAAVLLTYLLARRLAGPVAGLVAAGALAIYPALFEYQALLLGEPLASFLLAAGVLALLAARERDRLWAWGGCGALFAALALVRPEYLLVALVMPFAVLLPRPDGAALGRRAAGLAAMLAATVLLLAPWTIRNAIVLDRVVPVSTGSGKALYIGTHLEADGDGVKLRELLLAERPGLRERLRRGGPLNNPNRLILERVLARVAVAEHPGVATDVALGSLGREQLWESVSSEPLRFAGLLAEKGLRTWTAPARITMEQPQFRVLQLGLLAAAVGGMVILGARRRFEALVIVGILLYVTAVGALLIDSPRRALVALPLVAALAAVGLTGLYRSICMGGLFWGPPGTRRSASGARASEGSSTPRSVESSPDSNISSTMSQPPTSSPLT